VGWLVGGIAISYADRWFPTNRQNHSANNMTDIYGGGIEYINELIISRKYGKR